MVEKVGEANSRGAWCASLRCLDVLTVGRGSTASFKQRGGKEPGGSEASYEEIVP